MTQTLHALTVHALTARALTAHALTASSYNTGFSALETAPVKHWYFLSGQLYVCYYAADEVTEATDRPERLYRLQRRTESR